MTGKSSLDAVRWGHSQRTVTPELIHNNKNKQILYENMKQKNDGG
jgi:hypothetical protein